MIHELRSVPCGHAEEMLVVEEIQRCLTLWNVRLPSCPPRTTRFEHPAHSHNLLSSQQPAIQFKPPYQPLKLRITRKTLTFIECLCFAGKLTE